MDMTQWSAPSHERPRSVTILGSTGSVGQSTVDLIARDLDSYRVEALVAGRSVDRLADQARRLRIEQWLLLALRVAAIALVMLAAAGPYATPPRRSAAADPVHRIFVLDRSFSMAYRPAAETLFDRAKRRIAEIVADGPAGDGLSLIHMGGPAEVVVGVPTFESQQLLGELERAFPFLAPAHVHRLFGAYGLLAWEVLGQARSAADLGRSFGATLTEAEVRFLIEREWARSADDVLWRRSKLGLQLTPVETAVLREWMETVAGAERRASAGVHRQA